MGAMTALGGVLPALTSVASTAAAVNSTIGTIRSFGANPVREDQNLALRQLQERQNLQSSQNAAQSALDRKKLALEKAKSDEDRRKALRRAVSRQRAKFGSQGVGASSVNGSSEAVLLGLFEESDNERKQRDALDHVRERAIELNTSNRRALNLLQATQLQQRQKLQRLF